MKGTTLVIVVLVALVLVSILRISNIQGGGGGGGGGYMQAAIRSYETVMTISTTRRTNSSSSVPFREDSVSDGRLRQGESDNKDDESFSACLLIMDENHRLPEWLSYHYYTLPLRYLVVAVDPHSKTSPSRIFEKWRQYDRMTIVEWTDSDFTTLDLMINHDTDNDEKKLKKHRSRQNYFYSACIKFLQAQNRTWTAFHDADEYLMMNAPSDTTRQLLREPGIVLKMIQHYRRDSTVDGDDYYDEDEASSLSLKRLSLPQGPLSWYQHFQSSRCITFARALYGAVESTDEDISRDIIPYSFLNPRMLDTLRYRVRASRRSGARIGNDAVEGGTDGPAKSIIDVSQTQVADFRLGTSAHLPLKAVCSSAWVSFNLPLYFRHYIGSFASYTARDDAREGTNYHSREAWEKRSMVKFGGPDDDIRPWISGFVSFVGEEAAKYLLDGAGVLPPQKKNQTSESAGAFSSQRR